MNAEETASSGRAPTKINVVRSIRRRLMASIGVVTGGIITFVLFLAFLGSRFAWYQNLAVGLSILLAIPTIVICLWISWGLSFADRWVHSWHHDHWSD